LLRLYLNALLDNNPYVVIPTLVIGATLGLVAISFGAVQGDTSSIVMMAVVGVMALILSVVAIVDRNLNPRDKAKSNAGLKKGVGPMPRGRPPLR
jgi:hypothetical protein